MATVTINVQGRVPTHYCRVCGALWLEGADHWSLVSLHCGKCCDNALMGNQIVALEDPTGPEAGCQDCAKDGRFLCDTHGAEPGKVTESMHYAPDRQAAERVLRDELSPNPATASVPEDHWVHEAAQALRMYVKCLNRMCGPTGRNHLLSMLDRMQSEPMTATKACRWLGWIQCSLVAHGIVSLEDVKVHNKRFSEGASGGDTGSGNA